MSAASDPPPNPRGSGGSVRFIDVWSMNLHTELERIMDLIDDYPCIAMDTEFPGVVMRPLRSYPDLPQSNYQTLKCNVDLLKLIQLGLTFTDTQGKLPPGNPVWQFNFQFDLNEDFFAPDSIDLLRDAGLDFHRHAQEGIDVLEFAELLMTSGVVLNPDIQWISFHAGYDYGYFLRMMTCQALPKDPRQFTELLSYYFPTIYDIKQLIKLASIDRHSRDSSSSSSSSKEKDKANSADGTRGTAADTDSQNDSSKNSKDDSAKNDKNDSSNSSSSSSGKGNKAETSSSTADSTDDPGDANEPKEGKQETPPEIAANEALRAALEAGLELPTAEGNNGGNRRASVLRYSMGLQGIAELLQIPRSGMQHQAGSDSLLTSSIFFRLRDTVFNGGIKQEYRNSIYGLDGPFLQPFPPPNVNSSSSTQ